MIDILNAGILGRQIQVLKRPAVARLEDPFVVVAIDIDQFGVVVETDGRLFDIPVLILDLVRTGDHHGAVPGGEFERLLDIVHLDRPPLDAVAVTLDEPVDVVAGGLEGGGDDELDIVFGQIVGDAVADAGFGAKVPRDIHAHRLGVPVGDHFGGPDVEFDIVVSANAQDIGHCRFPQNRYVVT